MYRYADTLGFDLAVVVFVVGVMPLAVFLMQSKRKLARATALALMFAAVMYVAVFEHYRLHRPEVTELGLKRAIVPESVLEYIETQVEEHEKLRLEREFFRNQLVFAEFLTLPVAAEDDVVRAACARFNSDGMKVTFGDASRGASHNAPRAALVQQFADPDVTSSPPLMVHLSHSGAGDRFFRNALQALQERTCVDGGEEREGEVITSNEETNRELVDWGDDDENKNQNQNQNDAAAPEPYGQLPSGSWNDNDKSLPIHAQRVGLLSISVPTQTKSPKCSPWRVGSRETLLGEELFGSLTYRASSPRDLSFGSMQKVLGTTPYRAVFVVRDPRDVVTNAYLERIKTQVQSLSRMTKQSGDENEKGVEYEIDAFTRSISLSTSSPLELMTQQLNRFRQAPSLGSFESESATIGMDGKTIPMTEQSQDSQTISAFALSLRALSVDNNPNVKFVRFEDLLVANELGFELLARWFGVTDMNDIQTFVNACLEAQKRCRENHSETTMKVLPGSWEKHFTETDTEKFNAQHGALLKSLGYKMSQSVNETQ